jgi:hypothetical protein
MEIIVNPFSMQCRHARNSFDPFCSVGCRSSPPGTTWLPVRGTCACACACTRLAWEPPPQRSFRRLAVARWVSRAGAQRSRPRALACQYDIDCSQRQARGRCAFGGIGVYLGRVWWVGPNHGKKVRPNYGTARKNLVSDRHGPLYRAGFGPRSRSMGGHEHDPFKADTK